MEGYWQDFIDFAAAQKMDGVVIWGLKGFGLHGEDRFCREFVKYAHARHVKVIHGLGLNGYEVGQYIVHADPDLAATIPARFAGTQREKDTRGVVFCPSRPKSLALLKACLLRAADTGIDGFNFETGDVDFPHLPLPRLSTTVRQRGRDDLREQTDQVAACAPDVRRRGSHRKSPESMAQLRIQHATFRHAALHAM